MAHIWHFHHPNLDSRPQLQHVWSFQILYHSGRGLHALQRPLVFQPGECSWFLPHTFKSLQVFLWLPAFPVLSGSWDPLHSGWHPVLHSHQASGAGGGQEPADTEAIGCFTCFSAVLVPGCPMCSAAAQPSFYTKYLFLHSTYFCRRISSWKGLNK